MSWSVDTLFGLEGDAFEAERSRIISQYIKSLPEDKRIAVYATQMEIDLKRETMSPSDFNNWLSAQLTENLENLNDLLVSLVHLVEGPPKIKA